MTLVGAGLLAFFSVNELPPRLDRRRHAAIGETLAREALRHLRPGAGVIAIIRDVEAFPHPESEAQFKGFLGALRTAGVPITATQRIQVDPLRPVEVPPGDFYELLRKAPAGGAVVSFMGPPLLSPEQRARLGEIKAAVLAFCPGAVADRNDLRPIFEAGLLRAALVERRDVSAAKPGSSPLGAHAWCEAHYRLVQAADVGGLYEDNTGKRLR